MKLGRLLIAALIVAVVVASSTFQVRQGQQAIVTRFGSPQATVTDAGLHFKLPAPIDAVHPIDMRQHLLDPAAGEYLTQDKKNLLVDAFLVWSVADPLVFFQTNGSRAGAEARLTDILRSVVGDALSSYSFNQILTTADDGTSGVDRLGDDFLRLAAARAEDSLAVKIHAARVKRLNFPEANKRAVFARMESERDAISSGFRSEGRETLEKIKAQTDREESELLAEARRKATEMRGVADAEAASIYAGAYAEDPQLWTFLRSLSALEQTASDDSLFILPSDHPLLKVLTEPPPLPVPPPKEEGSGE